jgi:hypothetical protein
MRIRVTEDGRQLELCHIPLNGVSLGASKDGVVHEILVGSIDRDLLIHIHLPGLDKLE